MTAYAFETIGEADALAFRGDVDRLAFTAPGSSASQIQVAFHTVGGYPAFDSQTSVTSEVTGRTVYFGSYFGSPRDAISFPDGSKAIIGHIDNAADLVGGDEPDAIYAGTATLNLVGGGGNDTIVGGYRFENIYGGAGDDLFVFSPHDVQGGGYLRDTQVYIKDWQAGDRLSFGPVTITDADIYKGVLSSSDDPYVKADSIIGAGAAKVVALQYGPNVLVYADSNQDHGQADNLVWLFNANVSDLDARAFISTPAQPIFQPATVSEPQLPAAPAVNGYTIHADVYGDMDSAHIGHLTGAAITQATATDLALDGGSTYAHLTGTNFVYDANEQLVGGTITAARFGDGAFLVSVSGISVSAAPFGQWVAQDATQAAWSALLPGDDAVTGGSTADVIRVYQGNHVIHGGGGDGADSLFGGPGDDQIYANDPGNGPHGISYLRGGGGSDYILGSSSFDDINGNTGDDTIGAGAGDDWALGGQGQDMIVGDLGADIVNGNIGADTCVGGDGADTLRGGQGDDILYGDAGSDWMSGDLGSNTLTGGAGADTFHAGAGLDLITDFNFRETDRVLVDHAVTWRLAQSGADVRIDFSNGGAMILQNVALTALPSDWIVQV